MQGALWGNGLECELEPIEESTSKVGTTGVGLEYNVMLVKRLEGLKKEMNSCRTAPQEVPTPLVRTQEDAPTHTVTDPSLQASVLSITSVIMLAMSIGNTAAFDAILEPLNALLSLIPPFTSSTILNKSTLSAAVCTFLHRCITSYPNPVIVLSTLVRIAFAKDSLPDALRIVADVQQTALHDIDLSAVLDPITQDLDAALAGTALVDVSYEGARVQQYIKQEEDVIDITRVHELQVCYAVGKNSFWEIHGSSEGTLLEVVNPMKYFTSVAYVSGVLYVVGMGDTWKLAKASIGDGTVELTSVNWPAGVEAPPAHGHVHLTTDGQSLLLVTSSLGSVLKAEEDANVTTLLSILEDHIPDIDGIMETMQMRNVPFDLIADDVQHRLQENETGRSISAGLLEHLPAALDAASRRHILKQNTCDPTVCCYTVQTSTLAASAKCDLYQESRVSRKIFDFEGGMTSAEAKVPSLVPSSPITFEAWVRFRSLHNTTLIFIGSQAVHFHVTVGSGNGTNGCSYVAGGWKGGGGQGADGTVGRLDSRAALAEWVHIAVAYDGLATSVYINGVKTETNIAADAAQEDSNRYSDLFSDRERRTNDLSARPKLSGYNVVLGYELHGSMREVRVWKHARTQHEIVAGMEQALPVSPVYPLLWAHWQVSEGMGIRLFDSGPNGLHLKPVDDTLYKGGEWVACPATEELPLKYHFRNGQRRFPLVTDFTKASVVYTEGRLCILQPFFYRQVASEYDMSGCLVSEGYSSIPEGVTSLQGSEFLHVCNRTAVLSTVTSQQHVLPKSVLRDMSCARGTCGDLSWQMLRYLALLSLLGRTPWENTTKSIGGSIALLSEFLVKAETETDAYSCLVLLKAATVNVSQRELRLPCNDVVLPEGIQTCLLSTLASVRESFSDSLLPVGELVKDCINTCVGLVFKTEHQRSAALVSCLLESSPLTPELAAHCKTGVQAAAVLKHLLSQTGIGSYASELVALCTKGLEAHITESATPNVQPILEHLRAFQIAIAVHAHDTKDTVAFTEWTRVLLRAAACVFEKAASTVIDTSSGVAVTAKLADGLTGQALREAVLLILLIEADPFSTDSIEVQHTLSLLRTKINVFREKLSAVGLGMCGAFIAEVAEKVKIVSEGHSSTHPYRLDACDTVCIEGTSKLTITFDNGSKLDSRDELVVLYVDPVEKTYNVRTLKDSLSQMKLNLSANTAYVFAKGSTRNSSLGFGSRPNELARTGWGYAFTAKAVTSRPRFVLGWLHDVMLALTHASASIAKVMIKAGIEEGCPDNLVFRGGLHKYLEVSQGTKRQQAVPSTDAQSQRQAEVISSVEWRSFLRSHSLPSGDGETELILRIIFCAAKHLCSYTVSSVTWSALNYLINMRLKIQSLSIQGIADVTRKTEFLLHSMSPIPSHTSVTFDVVLTKIISFVFSEQSIESITNMLLKQREKARCRSRGLYSLRQLQAEAALWTRNVSLEGGCFMLQAVTDTLTEALENAPFSEGITCSGDVLMKAVRQDIYNLVQDLLSVAADIDSAPVKALVLSVLSLNWSAEDIPFLSGTIPAVSLLQEACLSSSVASNLFLEDKLFYIPGQSVSPKMIKVEDVDSWHLSVDGTQATVRHDGRGVSSAFLWNSHEVRKGKCVVQLTKPWYFKNEPAKRIWYFEVKFTECSHRLVKGISIGLCGDPLSQHYLYKNNGGVKTFSDSFMVLPRYRLNDVVGCGVCMSDGTPYLFYTLNGEFFGFMEPVHVSSLTPCVLVKYACKVQWLISPDTWMFDVRSVHASTTDRSRHMIIRCEAGKQAWAVLKKWTQVAMEEPCVLTEQCLTVLKDHALNCLTEGHDTWLLKLIGVIHNCLKAAGPGCLSRTIEELARTGWSDVLYGVLIKTLGGWADGIRASEAVLEVLYIILTRVGPQHQLAHSPEAKLPDLAIIHIEDLQQEDGMNASSAYDALSASLLLNSTIQLLIRGASEGAPFVNKTSDTSAIALLCIRLLRGLGASEAWAPYLETPLLTALHRSPRNLESLRADARNNGTKLIATFTALTVLGCSTLPLTRGTRCIYKPSYGTSQKCIVRDMSDEQHLRVVLCDSGRERELEVNRDSVTPYDPSPPLACAAAADAALFLCYDLIKSIPEFKKAGLTGDSLGINSLLSHGKDEYKIPSKETEALLPSACLLAALLQTSVTAATTLVSNNWPDRSLEDVLALASKPLSVGMTLPQLCSKKDMCIRHLEEQNWEVQKPMKVEPEAPDTVSVRSLDLTVVATTFGQLPLVRESSERVSDIHENEHERPESVNQDDEAEVLVEEPEKEAITLYLQELCSDSEEPAQAKLRDSGCTWSWCLLWLEAGTISAARCLLVKLRSAYEYNRIDNYEELLLMLDTITLNATSEQEEWYPVKNLVNGIIDSQDESNIVSLALDTFAFLVSPTASQGTKYATPRFELSLQLLEILINSKPHLLIENEDILASFSWAIHMHCHRSKRLRIIRCLSRLLSCGHKGSIATNWRCFGAIRYHCEEHMTILTPSSELVLFNKQFSKVALAEAEVLYLVRSLLLERNYCIDDVIVPRNMDTRCKWYMGKLVDKMDKSGKWYEAVVLAIREGTVYVTCKGLPSVHDEWVPKASNRVRPHLEMASTSSQRQDFGKYNDVSDILTNSSHKAEQRDTPLSLKTPKGLDQIADHMLAVDMQSATICKLYCALSHLAECLEKGLSIPAVWAVEVDDSTDMGNSPLDLISMSTQARIEDAYSNGPPALSPGDLPPIMISMLKTVVTQLDGKKKHEDSRYSNVVLALNYGVLLPALPCLGLDAPPEESFIAMAVNKYENDKKVKSLQQIEMHVP